MTPRSRTPVKRMKSRVLMVGLWSDGSGAGSATFTDSSLSSDYDGTFEEHETTKSSNKEDENAKRAAAPEPDESKYLRAALKKQRLGGAEVAAAAAAGDKSAMPECYSRSDNKKSAATDFLWHSTTQKSAYKRRCAARRVHSNQKMFFSRNTTFRLRGLPGEHSPLLARKLRFS